MAFDAGSILSTLDVDRDPFQTGLDWARAEGKKFAKEKYSAKLDLDVKKAREDLTALTAELTALRGRSVDVDVQIAGALEKIATLQAALDGLHAPDLRVELSGADEMQRRIRELRAELERLGSTNARPDVDLDGDAAALARIRALQAELDRLGASRARPDVDVNDRGGAARAAAGVSSLITGLLSLAPIAVPAGAAVAAALAAIPTGAALAVAGIGSIVLGLSGIGDAYKALQADQKAVGAGAGATGAAVAAAAQQMAAAERGLAQARESAADASARAAKEVLNARREAERGVSQALIAQRSAESSYTAAVRDAERAQESLTDARKAAKRTLEDLQFQTAGGALAERRAVLQLQDAEKALQEGRARGAQGRELEELTLSYQEAALSVDELRSRNARLAEDKSDADRRGVEGSRQVVAAQQQVQSANQRVADADRARADAAAAVTEAQRAGAERMADALANQERTARQNAYAMAAAQDALASAQRSLAQASAGTSATATKLKDTMSELTPEGRRFVSFLDEQMKPAIKGLRAEAQSNLLPGLQAGMEYALPVLPQVSGLIGTMAKEVGNLAERAGKGLNDPFWRNYISFLKSEAGPTMSTFGTIAGNSITTVAGISQGALPIWRQMGDGLERITGRWAAFAQQAAAGQNAKFNEFLAYVERTGPRVVDLLGDLATMVVDIGSALAPAGDLVLGFVDAVAEFIHSIPPPVLQAIATGVWAVSAAMFALGPVKVVMGLAALGVAALAQAVVALGTAAGSAGLVGLAGRLAGVATFLTGPWGIALGLATTALGFLWVAHQNASDAAKQQAESEKSFKDALVQSKGAIDDNVRSAVQKSIADATLADSGNKLLTVTDSLGITQDKLTDAITRGGKPLDDIRAKLIAARDAGTSYSASAESTSGDMEVHYTDAAQAASDALGAVDGLTAGFRRQQEESVRVRAAINGITVEQQKMRDASLQANDALLASIGADLTKEQTSQRVEAAQKRLADAIKNSGAGSLEARQATTDLNQTYLNLITQSGEAAAKQAALSGVVDTTQASLDAQRRKALELAGTMQGPLPAALQRIIDGMSLTDLTAAGAKVRIDNTGKAVAELPGGKTIVLNVNADDAKKDIGAIREQLLTLANGVTVPIFTSVDPKTGQVSRGGTASAGRLAGGGVVLPRAAGGMVLGGYEPGRDTVPALLSRGESVLVPEATRAIGPSNIMAINRAYSGRRGSVLRAAGGLTTGTGGPAAAAAPALPGLAGARSVGALPGAGGFTSAVAAIEALIDAQARLQAPTAAAVAIQQRLARALADSTAAHTEQTAAAERLRTDGVAPTVAALTGKLFPALDEQARLVGDVDVAAVDSLVAAHTPLQDQLARTRAASGAAMLQAAQSAQMWTTETGASISSVAAGLDATRAGMAATAAATVAAFTQASDTARMWDAQHAQATLSVQNALGATRDSLGVTAAVTGTSLAQATESARGWETGSGQAMGSVQGALGVTRDAMTQTKDWTGVQFSGMQQKAADPVRWIINNPLGDTGLVGAWNSLNSQFQMGKQVQRMVPGFAEGGKIAGPGTSTSDSIPAMLSDGEFVVRAGIAQRVPHFLAALNAGQPEAMQAAGVGKVADVAVRLASGGPATDALNRAAKVASAMNGKPYVWGGSGPNGADCSGYQSIITNALRGEANPYRRIGTTANFPWPGFAAGLNGSYAVGAFKGDPGHMAGTLNLAGMAAGGAVNVESGGSPSMVKFGGNAVGADHPQFRVRAFLPQIGGKFVSGGPGGGGGFDPSGLVAEAFRGTEQLIAEIPQRWGTGEPPARGQAMSTAAQQGAAMKILSFMVSLFNPISALSAIAGAGVNRYGGVVNQALTMMGQPASLQSTVLRRMQQESGGNPTSVNRWDVNWRNGTPSVGLMQVIGPTYAANKDPRADTGPYLYGVSTNPLANILSSMRYAMRRYGSLPAAYNRAGGYDNGGVLAPGDIAVNMGNRPENVLSAEQGDALTARLRGGTRGGDGADLVAVADRIADRIVAAIADMTPVNVFPRENQSEESIGAAVDRRRRTRSRTL